MKVLLVVASVVVASVVGEIRRVPDFEPVQELFTPRVNPGPSLSTSPGFDEDLQPAVMPGLRSGLQAAVGSAQLGVVSNVHPALRRLTFDIGACFYFCRNNLGQVYCCESDTQSPHVPLLKPGKCPNTCPANSAYLCRLDSDCEGGDKCCINPCDPQKRVCRAPVPL